MSGQRVLVAGGAGFLGSHLCDRFIDRGDEVICVDNLLTGTLRNVAHLFGHERFTVIEHDICEPLNVEGRIDLVMNMACPASPKDFATLPIEILDVCSRGVRNLLDLCRDHDAVFFQSSTSEVYGDPDVHPQPETYWGNVNPIGLRSCYDEAKRFAEALTMSYRRTHGVDTRIVRIFNTYGPRMRPDDGRVVISFLVAALTGQPITVYGDGTQTRSFCYVDDEVSGFLALADSSVGEPVNIGNPDEFNMLELAAAVLDVTGSNSPIEFHPLPSDDPTQRQPDISRARELLDWEPTVNLREGLTRMIGWLRDEGFVDSIGTVRQ